MGSHHSTVPGKLFKILYYIAKLSHIPSLHSPTTLTTTACKAAVKSSFYLPLSLSLSLCKLYAPEWGCLCVCVRARAPVGQAVCAQTPEQQPSTSHVIMNNTLQPHPPTLAPTHHTPRYIYYSEFSSYKLVAISCLSLSIRSLPARVPTATLCNQQTQSPTRRCCRRKLFYFSISFFHNSLPTPTSLSAE